MSYELQVVRNKKNDKPGQKMSGEMRCKVTIFFVFLWIEIEKYTAQEAFK